MKLLLALLFVALPVFAEELPVPQEVDREDYCTAWAQNAMYGATQQLRGAKPIFRFINDYHVLLEMIEHEQGGDYLYVLANDDYGPDHYFFLTKSILSGWSQMNDYRAANKDVPLDPGLWFRRFKGACMESRES